MACKELDNYLAIINDSTMEDLRVELALLWQDFHSCSLKDSEGKYKGREIFWKIRHIQQALKDNRSASQ